MTNNELQELGLPDIFLAIGAGTAPIDIQASCLPTGEFVAMQSDLALKFPPAANYVPLWMLNSFGVVAFDRRRGVYVQYHIGDKRDTVVARDYQELCTFLFLELMDAGLWDELDVLASLFRYQHLPELKAYVQAGATGPSDEVAQKFTRSLGR